MADDLYSDAAPAPEAPPAESEESGSYEGEQAIIPKSILSGKDYAPGDTVVLKIVSMDGDEVVVEASSEEPETEMEEEMPAETGGGMEPATMPGEMAGMMESQHGCRSKPSAPAGEVFGLPADFNVVGG